LPEPEPGGVVPLYFVNLTHLGALAWLIGGLALCAAERLAPGVFLVWVGGAAGIVGAFSYLVPIHFGWQLLLFLALAAAFAVIGERVYRAIDTRHGRALGR